jgi:hypothetical protein
MSCVLGSCAIHHEFPFICFRGGCVKQQFSLKPFKKRLQASMGRKRLKFSSSKSSRKRTNSPDGKTRSYDQNDEKLTGKKKAETDSIIAIGPERTFGMVDTVIRIYYADLSDSTLNRQKAIISSYVKRTGAKNITEILLTDIYSRKETDSDENSSLKKEIGKYLLDIGVSKHRVYRRRNEHLHDKSGKYKERLYLEVRIQ